MQMMLMILVDGFKIMTQHDKNDNKKLEFEDMDYGSLALPPDENDVDETPIIPGLFDI